VCARPVVCLHVSVRLGGINKVQRCGLSVYPIVKTASTRHRPSRRVARAMFSTTTVGYDFGGTNVRVPTVGGPHFPGGPAPTFNPGIHSSNGLSINSGPVGGELISQVTEDHLVAASVAPIIYAFLLHDDCPARKSSRQAYQKGSIIYMQRTHNVHDMRTLRRYGRGANLFHIVDRTEAQHAIKLPLTSVDVVGILAEPVVMERNSQFVVASVALEGLCDLFDFTGNIFAPYQCPGDIVTLRPAGGMIPMADSPTKYATLLVREGPNKWSVALHPGQLKQQQQGRSRRAPVASQAHSPGEPPAVRKLSLPFAKDEAGKLRTINVMQGKLVHALSGGLEQTQPLRELTSGNLAATARSGPLGAVCYNSEDLAIPEKVLDECYQRLEAGVSDIWQPWLDSRRKKGKRSPVLGVHDALLGAFDMLKFLHADQDWTATGELHHLYAAINATTNRTAWYKAAQTCIQDLGGSMIDIAFSGTDSSQQLSAFAIPALQINSFPVHSTAPTQSRPTWTSTVDFEVKPGNICHVLRTMVPRTLTSEDAGCWPRTESQEETVTIVAFDDAVAVLQYIMALWFIGHQCIVSLPANGCMKAAKKGDNQGRHPDPGGGNTVASLLWSALARQENPGPVHQAYRAVLDAFGKAVRLARALPAKPDDAAVRRYAAEAHRELTAALNSYKEVGSSIEKKCKEDGPDGTLNERVAGLRALPMMVSGIYLPADDEPNPFEETTKNIKEYVEKLAKAKGTGKLSRRLSQLQGSSFEPLTTFGKDVTLGNIKTTALLPYLAKAANVSEITLFDHDGSVTETHATLLPADGTQSLPKAYPCLSTWVGDEHTKLLCVEEWCRSRLRSCKITAADCAMSASSKAAGDGEQMDFVAPMIALSYTGGYVKELFGFDHKKTKKGKRGKKGEGASAKTDGNPATEEKKEEGVY
jgi:hypothetical protein